MNASKAVQKVVDQLAATTDSSISAPADGSLLERARPNRTSERVLRRHSTNVAAMYTKVIEAQMAIDGSAHLAHRTLDRQAGVVTKGNELIRHQVYQKDQEQIEDIVDQVTFIHNKHQQHILNTATKMIGDIIDRPPIEVDSSSGLQRAAKKFWNGALGESEEE